MIFTRRPPAAPNPATDDPPLPELSSSTPGTPSWRRNDSITVVPRSLKLPVGLNHSSLKNGRCSPQGRCTSGVQPSPMVIGSAMGTGSEARYRHSERVRLSISSREMPACGVTSSGLRSSEHQRGTSRG